MPPASQDVTVGTSGTADDSAGISGNEANTRGKMYGHIYLYIQIYTGRICAIK